MLRRFYVFVALMLMVSGLAMGASIDDKSAPRQAMRVVNGEEMINVPAVPPSGRPNHSSLDLIGELYQAGTTWYDYQHNGSAGNMIGVDGLSYVHIVWMNGLNSAQDPRHVYYNFWFPTTEEFNFLPGGTQVDASTRGGYTSMTVDENGFAYPAFHQGATDFYMGASIDFLPGTGAFTTTEPAHVIQGGLGIQVIWPKIAQGIDGKLHMVGTESPRNTDQVWQRQGYSRGTPEFDVDGFGVTINWDVVSGVDDEIWIFDSTTVIAPTIACSPTENRVAIAYSHRRQGYDGGNVPGLFVSQANNDLFVMISEDGGNTWADPMNVTAWPEPDFNCASGDSLECNGDTLRLYTDTDILFDENGYLHVAFTTCVHFEVGGRDFGAGVYRQQSGVWHWGEEFGEFTPIFNDYNFYYNPDSTAFLEEGAWQFNVQRPNFAYDDSTGYLYCSVWRYEGDQWNDALYRMGDAYVSVSATCGRSWSEAVNVTDTDGGQDTPAPGSLSERDITLADKVTYDGADGYLHMSYVMDHDAGGVPQNEGVATLCEVYYQRIPVSEIPVSPILNPYWPALHIDSTGFPGMVVELDTTYTGGCLGTSADDQPSLRPESFALYQNYPNPFNPSTKISFDLIRDARVTLKVFNVMGQEVATLIDGKVITAGAQHVSFDASDLASGVYLYRLSVDGVTASKKMVLMK